MKLKQLFTLMAVIISALSIAQLTKPTLIGSQKYSAFGKNAGGTVGTITYPIPAGTTNKNRILVISQAMERVQNPVNTNWPNDIDGYLPSSYPNSSNPDYSITYNSPFIGGIEVPFSQNIGGAWHGNSGSDTHTASKSYFMILRWDTYYMIPDTKTGNLTITFPWLNNPKTDGDEMSVIVSVYENVKSIQKQNSSYSLFYQKPFTNTSYTFTGTLASSPLGRTDADILYLATSNVNEDTDYSLPAVWSVVQNSRVTNNASVAVASPYSLSDNEPDGITHIIGRRYGTGSNPTIAFSRTNNTEFYNGSMNFYSLLPFASPSVTGTVYRDTDGATNINGTATNAGGTYVNVINSDNKVVYSATVSVAGAFTVPTGYVEEGKIYRLELSKNQGTIGATAPAKELPSGWGTVGENATGVSPYPNDDTNDGTINLTIGAVNISGLRYGINTCAAGTTAPPVKDIINLCPAIIADLTNAHTGTTPLGASLVWFNNNAHSGTALSGTQITQAGAGTYYSFYYDSTGNCYSPASSAVTVTITNTLDSDGDGIPDACDLDDDNDGIPDALECPVSKNTFFAYYNIGNYNANVDAAGTNIQTANASTIGSGLTRSLISPFNYMELRNIDAANETQAIANNEYVEYTFTTNAKSAFVDYIGYYTTNSASTGEDTQYWFSVRISADNFASNTSLLYNRNYTAATGAFEVPVTATYWLAPNTTYTIRVYFYAVGGGASATIAHDDFKLLGYVECDTDGDGIPNRLDLDSDGDGCPDAIEGGASFTSSNLVSSSMPGGNSGAGYTGTSVSPVVQNLGNTVGNTPTTMGVPTIAGTGQAIGDSQNGAVSSQCPVCNAGTTQVPLTGSTLNN